MTYLLTQLGLYLLCALILGVILGWLIWGRLRTELRKAEADRADLSAQLKHRGDGSNEKGRIDRLNAELDACRKERRVQKEELERLNRELALAKGPAGDANMGSGAAAAATLMASDDLSTDAQVSELGDGQKPKTMTAARDGKADDLKLIKGIGAKLEDMLNGMGFFHFDQIADWTSAELAWVDNNLEGFKGRASRDEWISQARILASGGTTEFASRNS